MSLKIGINLIKNYSINFDLPKRSKKLIKFIIIHYTGMKKELNAVKKLCSPNSKVSCHYFIKNNGEVVTLVPNLYVAWHAGISNWKKYKSLNKFSIGIEISNPGHNFKYRRFSKKQIIAIIKLSRFLIKKYKIKPSNFLGHSDIAPDRKKDPGEKFPWKYLSKKKIGIWHKLNSKQLIHQRNIKIGQFEKKDFIQNLFKIGYARFKIKENSKIQKKVIIAFQRRFRQELINGEIDKECLLISKNLAKQIK